jgi:hypothetical protein
MKKEMLVMVLAVFLVVQASALTFEKTAISDVIVPEFNQPAVFNVALSGIPGGNYQLYTLTDVSLSPKGYFVLGNAEDNITLGVYKTEQLTQTGYYSFVYSLRAQDGTTYNDRMTVKIVPLAQAIEVSSDTIAPDSNQITFYIMNKERAQLTDVNVRFESMFFNVNKKITLKPFEKMEISVPVDKNNLKTTKAGAYVVKSFFQTDKGEVRVDGKLYLGEKKDIRTEQDSSGFIIYTDTITKMNTGNVPQEVTINVKKNIITRLFTSFNNEPDGITRTGLGITYTWTKTIDPAEVLIVKARTNYIFPVFILIFAGLIIFVFKRYTETKIEVKKSVSPVRAKGGELALRVSVRVKARRSVESVSIIDRVPALVKIYESFGIIKPTKVDSANRRIHWNLGDLQSGEERIVSYIIYSKIGVVGKFSLPPALAVFEKDGKIHEIESNNVFYLTEQAQSA